jgi:hypothetical protein
LFAGTFYEELAKGTRALRARFDARNRVLARADGFGMVRPNNGGTSHEIKPGRRAFADEGRAQFGAVEVLLSEVEWSHFPTNLKILLEPEF